MPITLFNPNPLRQCLAYFLFFCRVRQGGWFFIAGRVQNPRFSVTAPTDLFNAIEQFVDMPIRIGRIKMPIGTRDIPPCPQNLAYRFFRPAMTVQYLLEADDLPRNL